MLVDGVRVTLKLLCRVVLNQQWILLPSLNLVKRLAVEAAVLLEEPPQAARPRAAAEAPATFRKLRREIIFFIIVLLLHHVIYTFRLAAEMRRNKSDSPYALTDLQLRLEGDLLGRGAMLNLPHQQLDALQCDLFTGLDDGGHHRHAVAGHRDAIKTDH